MSVVANGAKKPKGGKGKGGKGLTIRPDPQLKAIIEALASLKGISVNEYTIRLYRAAVRAEEVEDPNLIESMKRRHEKEISDGERSPKESTEHQGQKLRASK